MRASPAAPVAPLHGARRALREAASRWMARALAVATLLLMPAAARAAGTLDQTSPFGNHSFNVASSGLTWQQQIKAGFGGQLAGITLDITGTGTLTLGIRKGAAPSTQALVFQQVVTSTGNQSHVFVDMTAANIPIAAGEVFVMELNGNAGLVVIGTSVAPPGTPLYSQPLYLNGTPDIAGDRIGFMSYVYCTPGATCNDSNACTTNDVCSASRVCAGTPVVCNPLDACHVGTCDPSTGACQNPAKPNGTACNDHDACTQTDTCQGGVCTGASPVTCTAMDQCHDVGTCNPTTGACTNPLKMDGAACSDSNACTQLDTCQAGVCTPGSPVVCPPPDQCHDDGVCDPATGTCTHLAKTDGTACDDGDLCTQNETCQSGACTPGTTVACTAMDPCHDVGVCDPTTGMCSSPNKMDGVACDDGDKCTQADTCQGGVCAGANPVTCSPLDACHVAGTCDPQAGTCSNPAAPDGTACTGGTCMNGACAPTEGTGGAGGAGGGGTGGSATTGSGGNGTVNAKGGCRCGVADSGTNGSPAVALLLLVAARRRSRRWSSNLARST